MSDLQTLKNIASQVRRDSLRMVHAQASGHPGGALGTADYFTALYFEVMKFDPRNFTMEGDGEDMFFLSNGHLSAVWYSVLARSGYFAVSELKSFRMINSRLQGHPTNEEGLPGVRIASGSLGQGLSVAAGTALAKKLNNDPNFIFCLTGDGELQEGQIWEALMFAAHNKVDNLLVTVDYNKQQIDGSTDEVMSLGDLGNKFASFGWEVLQMDGNNMEEILQVIPQAQSRLHQGKPVVVLMKTEMGMGVDFMTGTHAWHGKAPNDDQLAKALAQLPETPLGDY